MSPTDLQNECETLKEHFAEGELVEEIVLSEGEYSISALIKDVKITHIPTGIEVISDQYDTQIKNAIAGLKELIEKLKNPG